MTPETLHWKPARTRVIPERGRQNPWSGAIDVVADHQSYVRSLRVDCSFREEVEDWEVLQPPMPVLSATSWDTEGCEMPIRYPTLDEPFPYIDPTRGVSDWFPISDRARAELGLDGIAHPLDEPPITTKKQAKSRWKKRRKTPRHVFTLDDNYEAIEAFDRRITRRDDHWFVSSSPVVMTATDGHRSALTPNRAAWLVDHASLSSTQRLLHLCAEARCIAPAHQRLVGS